MQYFQGELPRLEKLLIHFSILCVITRLNSRAFSKGEVGSCFSAVTV